MNAALGSPMSGPEYCYDENNKNKKGWLKELKVAQGAYVKPENSVMTRKIMTLMTC